MKPFIMKNHLQWPMLLIIFSLMSNSSCGPSQRVTSSWKNPEHTAGKQYRKVFIAAITGNHRVRVSLEEHMARAARGQGMTVVKSLDEFPSTFTRESTPDKEIMLTRIRALDCDLIYTVTLLEKKSEARYVPGTPYMPYPGYGLRFRGYYQYWWPMMYDPGYYTTDRTYSMEGNLFDVESERLIWSVQTESFNPDGIDAFSRGMTEVMLERAVKDLKMR
jgi:hypothetical protein